MLRRYTLREIRALLADAELPPLRAEGDFEARVMGEFGVEVARVYGGKERFARAQLFADAPAIIRQLLRKGTAKAKGKVRL